MFTGERVYDIDSLFGYIVEMDKSLVRDET